MNHAVVENYVRKPRILVVPLDWGLGHATRCIPIIHSFLAAGCEVLLAGERSQEKLLRTEFPHLLFLSLKGYRVRYPVSALGMTLEMLIQIPKFLRRIKKENKWLKKVVQEHTIDAVVSDNRFGLYHKKIPCIFITHQLAVKSPWGKWSERLLQKRNYRYINRFQECWVPDAPDEDNLAGELSHPGKKPGIPLHYIGPLSRFQYTPITEEKNHLLFLLSGPEPQRSLFENRIVAEVAHYNRTAVIVRGLPEETRVIPSTNMIRFYNHLPTDMLSNEIGPAEFVISRSGYSTVMDMSAMKKKCIFVPTPGQTEQEYLAEYLEKKQFACFLHQNAFSLTACLEQAAQFKYRIVPPTGEHILKEVIERFCDAIRVSIQNLLATEEGRRQ